MGQFNLIVQHPTVQEPVHGVLVIDRHGEAQFFSGDCGKDSKIIGTLSRSRVEHAGSNGILISGMERTGNGKWILQEWWLVFAGDNNAP